MWFNRVLWLKVSSKLQWSKAAVMPSLAGKGAWDLPQAHSRSGQQVPFFIGCWTETSAFREPSSRRCPLPGPCHAHNMAVGFIRENREGPEGMPALRKSQPFVT